jgi:hypothetical protein
MSLLAALELSGGYFIIYFSVLSILPRSFLIMAIGLFMVGQGKVLLFRHPLAKVMKLMS